MIEYFDPYAPIDDLINKDIGVTPTEPTLREVNQRRELFGLAHLTKDQYEKRD